MYGTKLSAILRICLMAAILAVWEWAVIFFQMPAYILPAPSKIFFAFMNGITSNLYIGHIGVTLGETLLGFMLGCALAFMLGTIVALSRSVEY